MTAVTSSVPERSRLAVTLGDLSGIGPELAVKLLADEANRAAAEIHLLVSAGELARFSAEAGVRIPVSGTPKPGNVLLAGSRLADRPVERGVASLAGGQRVMSDLRDCLQMFKQQRVDAIMFLPLNKSALHAAGMHEEDELRWFARELGYAGTTSELNFAGSLVTSRVTSHCALREVPNRISARSVFEAIRLLNDVITASDIERPRLAVCALNPHAGESGRFGREEIDHIAPGVRLALAAGIDVRGPFPGDTVFIAAQHGEYDGVVTMYHDQGQIAMKLMGFEGGVTVQGGLPVPIVTPAHGTAYDMVGQNRASLGPARRAFEIAVALGRRTARRRMGAAE